MIVEGESFLITLAYRIYLALRPIQIIHITANAHIYFYI